MPSLCFANPLTPGCPQEHSQQFQKKLLQSFLSQFPCTKSKYLEEHTCNLNDARQMSHSSLQSHSRLKKAYISISQSPPQGLFSSTEIIHNNSRNLCHSFSCNFIPLHQIQNPLKSIQATSMVQDRCYSPPHSHIGG